MAEQVEELAEQLVFLTGEMEKDPENSDLKALVLELRSAKSALEKALKESAKSPRVAVLKSPPKRVYCSVRIGDGDRVGRLIKDENGLARIGFLGVQTFKDFPNNQVTYLTSAFAGAYPGAKLQAVLEDDGLWYDCVVVRRLPEDKVVILFDGYKDEVIMPLIFLRERPSKSVKNSGTTYTTPAGYRIPENLKIDEQDNARVRQAKKRKIEDLKKEQRQERRGEEAESRKKSWLDFKKSVNQ